MPRRSPRTKAKPARGDQRRELRRKLAQPVVVRGLLRPGQRFDKATRSRDASLRGMSLLLPMPLSLDTAVLVENPATGVRTLYRVARVERLGKGAYEVGFEAPDPNPRFWSAARRK